MTVAELVPKWLAHKEATVKPSSYAACTNVGYMVIAPEFGGDDLDAIDEGRLQGWVLKLIHAGRFGRRTIHDRLVHMRGLLKFAERRGLRKPQGPISVRIPHVFVEDDVRVKTIGAETIEKLMGAIVGELSPKSCGVAISLMAGLRIGEVCGLKWSDIDLESDVLHVRRTVYRCYENTGYGKGKTRLVVGPPKSRTSRRDVYVSSALKSLICKLSRPVCGDAYFISVREKPLEVRTYREFVVGFLARHGIERFNFHALRHTFATQCIENGADAKTVSEILGHSTVNLTLNLYVHPTSGQKRKAVEQAFSFAPPHHEEGEVK